MTRSWRSTSKSAFFGTQIAAKQMIKQECGGRIINISSVHEDQADARQHPLLPVQRRYAHADAPSAGGAPPGAPPPPPPPRVSRRRGNTPSIVGHDE